LRAKRLPLGLKKTKHKKVIKRLMIAALSLFVIFSQMSLSPLGKAFAEDNNSNTQQFLDSVKLTTGENDTAKDVSADNPLKKGDAVNLDYSWTQKAGQQLSADKDITIQIPSQFKLGTKDANGKYTADATGDVKLTDNTTVIGTYTVKASDAAADANKLTIHFDSEKTPNLTGASGKLVIPAVFDDEIKADQTTDTIDFDLGNNQKQTANVAVKAEAEQTETASSDSKTATSDASSSGSSKSSDASSTNDQTKADASSTDEAKASDSSSSKDGSSTDGSSVQANKDGADDVSNPVESKTAKSTPKSALRSFTAAAVTPREITEIQFSNIKITDADGNLWSSSNRPGLNSPAKIDMTWSIPDTVDVNDGDYYEFDLPQQFAIYSTITGDLTAPGNGSVGTFTITPDSNNVGHVKMVFNSFGENHSQISGTLHVNTEFNQKEITGSTQQKITFPFEEPYTVTIPFKPSTSMSTIDKQGNAWDGDTQTNFNATTIKWTVNINKTESHLTNAKVTDPTPDGLTLDKSSIKIYPVTVNVNGTIVVGDTPIDSSKYTLSTSDGNLEVDFKDPIDSAYQIRYTTTITDKTKNSFTNTATLQSKENGSQPTSATVSISHGAHLKKASAYDAKTQTITWTVNYNGDMQSISNDNAILHDWFDNSQSLVPGSIHVYNATATSATAFTKGSEIDSSKYTVTAGKIDTDKKLNGFDLQFKNDINSAYQIVYQTKPNDAIDGGQVINNGTVNNTVTEGSTNSTSDSQTINQQNLIKKWNTADYNLKRTSWTMTINGNNYRMKNASITDTFDNGGLTLLSETVSISDTTSGKILINGKDYSVTTTANGFKITFLDGSSNGGTGNYTDTTDSFTLMYSTAFDYTQIAAGKTNFPNTAVINWTDKDGKSQTSTSTDTFYPDGYTQNDGYKYGSYNANTKEITWKVGFNYNKQTINTPILKDPILGTQQFENDSLEVHYMTLTGDKNGVKDGGIVPATNYTVDYPSTSNSKTLTITFSDPINSPYYITYKTSLANTVIDKTYSNTAKLFDNEKQLAKLDASVSPNYGGTFASKSGTQNGDNVDWNILINPSQSTISNAVLTDVPTNNQIIDPDSIHLYSTTVDSSGNVTKGTEVTDGYTLNVADPDNNGNQQFVLNFTNQISQAYVLTYSTIINAGNGSDLSNTATLKGTGTEIINQPSKETVTVKTSSGSGTGNGVNGSLDVKKVDADNGSKTLSGAVFTLYDSTGTKALRTITTDSSGMADFNNFKYGTYVLKEITAPSGYVLNPNYEAGEKVTIGSTDMSQTNPITKVTVSDQKYVGRVVLTKTDAIKLGLKLGGAVYQLQDQNGQPINGYTNQTTDELTGQVTFDNLQPGKYQLVELSAPNNYQLDSSPHPFTIASNQTTEIDLSATNKIKPGGVELDKVDSSGHFITSSSAIFSLTDSDGNPAKDADGNTISSDQLTTKDGKIILNNLRPGSYTFKELTPPNGYLKNSNILAVTIVAGQSSTQNIKSFTDYQGTAQIKKVNLNEKPLEGATFNVVDTANSNKVVKTVKTNSSGIAEASGLVPGNYAFIETIAPTGYIVNKTPMPFAITDTAAGAPQSVNAGTLTDYQGSVQMKKTDDHNNGLDNAIFKITDLQGNLIQDNLKSVNGGLVAATGLAPGTYHLVETKAPDGYIQNLNEIEFKILAEADGLPSTVIIPGYFINYKGSAGLTKTGVDGSLANAHFVLQQKKSDGSWETIKSDLVTSAVGTINVSDLSVGDYQFVETQAPDGYLIHDPVTFSIDKTKAGAPDKQQVNIQDSLNKITLTKVDKNDKDAVLIGAEFKLVGEDGKTVVDKDATGKTLPTVWSTNDKGQFTINGLAPGEYSFIETKAPNGYELDATPIPFKVTNHDVSAQALQATDKLNSVVLTKVDKNDKDAVLKGAEFKLVGEDGKTVVEKDATGKDLQKLWTTDDQGQFTVNGLTPGAYNFIETKAPNGYELDATPIPFTVTNTDAEAIPVSATDKLNSITLTKVDKNDNNIHLQGAEFKLVGQDGKTVVEKDATGKTIPKVWTTDAQGQFTVSGLVSGAYNFIETKAPNGYELDATPIPFTVTNTDAQAKEVTATDNLNKVVFTKVDKNDANAVLKGAEFKLIDSNLNVVNKDVAGKSLPSIWTTDNKGQFTVNGLPSGSYSFVETKAPNGYELDATPIPFTVTNTDVKAIPITATDKLNSVVLTKVDENDKDAVLQGAEFKLVDKDGKVVEKDVTGKDLQKVWTTDAKGQFTVNGLTPGTYNFIETKAPNGYELDATPIPFKVTNEDVKAVPITATDKLNSVVLTKVDKNDKDAVLKGAEFKLVDKDGNTVAKDATGKALSKLWTTNDQGQFTVNGLAPGKYNFIETKAPNGYELDATPIPFEVTNTDVKAVEITATDKINSIILTKADKNDKDAVLAGAEFKLYDSNGNLVAKDANGKALPNVWKTNDQGQFTINGLAPGNYHFIETKAPKDYDLDATPIPFQVTATDVKAIEITATDKLTPGDVRLTKVDRNDKDAVLKGAVFKLTDSNGKTLKTGLTTDNSGQFVVKGLAPGKYFFIETKAPKNYALDDTPISFVIEKGQAKAVEITATDKPLEVTKSLDGKPGATYNVVDENGHVITRGVMADEEGNVNFKGLATGKYHLVLVRGVEAEVQTTKKSKGLPITGDVNDFMTMAAGAILLLGGGFLTIFSRRRKNN